MITGFFYELYAHANFCRKLSLTIANSICIVIYKAYTIFNSICIVIYKAYANSICIVIYKHTNEEVTKTVVSYHRADSINNTE